MAATGFSSPLIIYEKLSEDEMLGVKDFLSYIPDDDVFKTANTMTKSLLTFESKEEAIKAICSYAKDVIDILNRQRIRKDYLFSYLHSKEIFMPPDSTKRDLISIAQKFWQKKLRFLNSKQPNSLTKPNAIQVSEILPTQNGIRQQVSKIQPTQNMVQQRVNEIRPQLNENQISTSVNITDQLQAMGIEFSKWYYNLQNSIHPLYRQHCQTATSEQLSVSHFTPDCGFLLTEFNQDGSTREVASQASAVQCVQFLTFLILNEDILFQPNVPAGVKATQEGHGLMQVLVAGTVYQRDVCIGLFEQIFGLVRDFANNDVWKIKLMRMNVKKNGGSVGRLSLPGYAVPISA